MIVYEWDVEEVADGDSEHYEDGEIINHNHQDSYKDCLRWLREPAEPGIKYVIVLVRDALDKYGSLRDRSWAYVRDGKLPEAFEDAYCNATAKVPQRFHNEIKRAQ